jgi:hypothetical protein
VKKSSNDQLKSLVQSHKSNALKKVLQNVIL